MVVVVGAAFVATHIGWKVPLLCFEVYQVCCLSLFCSLFLNRGVRLRAKTAKAGSTKLENDGTARGSLEGRYVNKDGSLGLKSEVKKKTKAADCWWNLQIPSKEEEQKHCVALSDM